MIWLIIFIGVMAYAVYRINTFADEIGRASCRERV